MRRKTFIVMLLLAAIALSTGCDSGKTENTTAATTATTNATSATTATETEATTEAVTSSVTTTAAATEIATTTEDLSEYPAMRGLDGEMLYPADAGEPSMYGSYYNVAFYRESNGFFEDNISNPEYFDIENYIIDAENPIGLNPWIKVRAGDKIGDLTVEEAVCFGGMYNMDDTEATFASNTLKLSGEITMDCVVQYYESGDDLYIAAGDIFVIPDPRSGDILPQISFLGTPGCNIGVVSPEYAYAADSDAISCGNLITGYEGTDVADVIQGRAYCRARVTLSDIVLDMNDQCGNRNEARIIAIEAID